MHRHVTVFRILTTAAAKDSNVVDWSIQSIRRTLVDAGAQVDRGLRRVAWPIYCLLLLCAAGFLVFVGSNVIRRAREFSKAGSSQSIALPVAMQTPPPRDRRPEFKDPGKSPEQQEPVLQPPVIAWKSEKYAYRAAALLARNNDLRAAIALLNESNADHTTVESLADAAISKLRTSVGPIVSRELMALATYWRALPPADREALFSLPRRGELAKLEARIADGKAGIAEIEAHLPQTIKYCLMCNLHIDLHNASKVPEPVIELFVEAAFPTDSLAGKLYLEKRPASRTPFTQHASAFSSALNHKLVWPLAREFIARELARAKKVDKPGRDWRMQIWGKDFCAGFQQYNAERAQEAATLELFSKLPGPMRKLWADGLVTTLLRSHQIALSDAAVAGNPWLRDAAAKLDNTFLLNAVRRYPAWQTALRSFDYRGAEAAAIAALKELWAGKYKIRPGAKRSAINWDQLMSALRYEERIMADRTFAWKTLSRQLGGVREGVPDPIRETWGLFAGQSTGKRWRHIDPRFIHAALIRMAQRNPAKRIQYSLLAKRYAENRDLRLKK